MRLASLVAADEQGNELPLKKQLEELPDDLDQISGKIEDSRASIARIHDDPHVVAEYQKKEAQINELQEVRIEGGEKRTPNDDAIQPRPL